MESAAGAIDYGDGQLISMGFWLPPEQENLVRELQGVVGNREQLAYTFDRQWLRPWVRIYEGLFPIQNEEKMVDRLRELMRPMVAIPILWGELEETQEVVVLWARQSEAATYLQEAIMEAVKPLREGYVKQKYINKTWEPIEQASIERWGWPWVEEFAPYVVVARALSRFELRDFEVLWEEKRAVLTDFMVAAKPAPGRLKPLYEKKLPAI